MRLCILLQISFLSFLNITSQSLNSLSRKSFVSSFYYDINNSNHLIQIRVSKENQVLNIYSDDSVNYRAYLVNYFEKKCDNDSVLIHRDSLQNIYEIIEIERDVSANIANLILNLYTPKLEQNKPIVDSTSSKIHICLDCFNYIRVRISINSTDFFEHAHLYDNEYFKLSKSTGYKLNKLLDKTINFNASLIKFRGKLEPGDYHYLHGTLRVFEQQPIIR